MLSRGRDCVRPHGSAARHGGAADSRAILRPWPFTALRARPRPATQRAPLPRRFRCARWCRTSSRCSRCAPGSPRSASRSRASSNGRSAAIVFAAVLDGIDGRVARLLKGTSRFGAELDSLADFVNFGVAPALILYFWGLHELEIGGLDRRHGVRDLRRAAPRALQRDDRRSQPAGLGGQFLRRHAGAGAARSRCCCRSICISSACRSSPSFGAGDVRLHARHRLPDGVAAAGVFRQARRQAGARRKWCCRSSSVVVLFFALLITYPWEVLTIGTSVYLASLPFGLPLLPQLRAQRPRAAAAGAAPVPAERTAAPAQQRLCSAPASHDAGRASDVIPDGRPRAELILG